MKPLSLALALLSISCAARSGPGPVTPETRVERQMIGLLEKFDRWDLNGDGYLTASELGPSEQITGRKPAEVIKFYDTNNDGKISLREAQAGYSRADEVPRLNPGS